MSFKSRGKLVSFWLLPMRHELATGTLVGGRSHVTKARERVRQLQKILGREDLSAVDQATATRILHGLQDALNTGSVRP